jgi:hypothetical protein
MKTKSEYMRLLAQDREQWREMVQSVTQKFCESREEKVIKQEELTKEAETKREERK